MASLVVGSKVREALKSQDVRVDGALIDALDEHVGQLIDSAVASAKANNRGTVKGSDVPGGGAGDGDEGAALVVASQVRERVRQSELRMQAGLVDALSTKVRSDLKRAVARAKGNNRSTVRPHDL